MLDDILERSNSLKTKFYEITLKLIFFRDFKEFSRPIFYD